MVSKINQKRIQVLNSQAIRNDKPVVYWMNRDCRVHDNWALIYAEEKAREQKVPLLVVYNLVPQYLHGGERQWDFKVKGLIDVEQKLQKLNIPFSIIVSKSSKSAEDILKYIDDIDAGLVVTDFSPVKVMREWTEYIAKHAKVQVAQVDAHNIVPVWVASPKREFGAYTLRPKIHKLVDEFLTDFPTLKKYPYNAENIQHAKSTDVLPAKDLLSIDVSHSSNTSNSFRAKHNTPVQWITPGETAASIALKHFIKNTLPKYHLRNDPNANAQSGLSPYLHYGHISAQRVALEVWKDSGIKDIQNLMHKFKNAAGNAGSEHNHSAFLEELVVRRELADNFCWYVKDYDKTSCFPDWSQKNLKKTAGDKRDYIYDLEEFEEAKTHDQLWNAAQMEMVTTGKMHGYMRMYWAKKILEWTPDVQTAMNIAIELNDAYELDGRDPNGYAGIAWSLGGVHDRAWFGRPVFGKVRYMNAKGCKSKFDTDAYIEKWLPKGKLF